MKAQNAVQKKRKDAVDQIVEKDSVLKQIVVLYDMPIQPLKERYLALFPNAVAPANKGFLIHRIAHKLQEDAFGGMSAPAQSRLEALKMELNPLKDLGQNQAKNHISKAARRLPMPGTVIAKTYKGRKLEVKVLQKGFEYGGKPYKSLSRIAREISGVHQSGFVFFNI